MTTPPRPDEPDASAWPSALERVLTEPSEPTLVFQPIVDLTRGVIAGFEALSRFEGPPKATPDRWFHAAERHGCAVQLELRAVERALEAHGHLPADTFLTVNVTPQALLHPEARALLERGPALHRLVIEVTEHAQVTDYHALREAADRVRAAGGLLAVDDAGAGYASLQHVLQLRPNFVKLDRELITGVDTDPTKRSVVQMLGELTDRIDAWLIAEGIETRSELDALLALDVPLGQGWALARPAPAWAELTAELVEHLRAQHQAQQVREAVAALLEQRPAVVHGATLAAVAERFAEVPGLEVLVQLDPGGRPAGLRRRAEIEAGRLGLHPVLSVSPEETIASVARRAMNRPASSRFDPVVCRHPTGAYVGVVTVERMVEWLADDR